MGLKKRPRVLSEDGDDGDGGDQDRSSDAGSDASSADEGADDDAADDGSELVDDPNVVVLCEPILPVRGPKAHFQAVRYASDMIKLNDAVELMNPGGLPHLGRVTDIYTNAKREPQILVQWFYRVNDLPPDMQRRNDFETNEVFLSDHRDPNPVQSIIRKCIVHSRSAPPLPPGRAAQYICNKAYSVNAQPPRLDPLPSSNLIDGNRQLANVLESGLPIRMPSRRERERNSYAHTSQRRKRRSKSDAGASGAAAAELAAAEATKKRKSYNSYSSDYGILDLAEPVATAGSSSSSSGIGGASAAAAAGCASPSAAAAPRKRSPPPASSASSTSGKRRAGADSTPASPAIAAAAAATTTSSSSASLTYSSAPAAASASAGRTASVGSGASKASKASPSLGGGAGASAASPATPAERAPAEVPIDPAYLERIKRFRQQQLAAPSAVPVKAPPASRDPPVTTIRPLHTSDGVYDISACMRALANVSQASLIKPSVEQAVHKLLLGVSWDSAFSIWVLSALDLCARDSDLRECAESLNILFNASAP